MSSVLSAWFYVLTLGIAALLLIALIFIFYDPSVFLQLTSASGQFVDLSETNNFDPTSNTTIAATAQSAVIKIGGNSYAIADNPVSIFPNALVQPGVDGITATNDLANSQVTGTFLFWLLMLGIGFLALLLAFVAVKYPEKLFGPQVSALVRCLPKKKPSCTSSRPSSSCGCVSISNPLPAPISTPSPSAKQMLASALASVQPSANTSVSMPPVQPKPSQPTVVTPLPAVSNSNTATTPFVGWTPQQLEGLKAMMAMMSSGKALTQ